MSNIYHRRYFSHSQQIDSISDKDESYDHKPIGQVAQLRPKFINTVNRTNKDRAGLQYRRPKLYYVSPKGLVEDEPQSDIQQENGIDISDERAHIPQNLQDPTPKLSIFHKRNTSLADPPLTPFTKKSSEQEGFINYQSPTPMARLGSLNLLQAKTLHGGVEIRSRPQSGSLVPSISRPKDGTNFGSFVKEMLNKDISTPVTIELRDLSMSLKSPQLNNTERSKSILKLKKDLTSTMDKTPTSFFNTRYNITDASPISHLPSPSKKVSFSKNCIMITYTTAKP